MCSWGLTSNLLKSVFRCAWGEGPNDLLYEHASTWLFVIPSKRRGAESRLLVGQVAQRPEGTFVSEALEDLSHSGADPEGPELQMWGPRPAPRSARLIDTSAPAG